MRSKPAFKLPPHVSCAKQQLPFGFAFVFRHDELGTLGRIVLTDDASGQCRITSEVAGDPSDPMTETRLRIVRPLTEKLIDILHQQMGLPPGEYGAPQAFPPDPTECVASRVLLCDHCDAQIGMLIFAPGAKDAGDLEDQARKMFDPMREMDLPTWVIGASHEPQFAGDYVNRVWVRKVWPEREAPMRLTPTEFDEKVEHGLRRRHCEAVGCDRRD